MSEIITLDQLAIVILNWNGFDHTVKCVESIQGAGFFLRTILILDNGSTPRQDELLSKRFPAQVTVIREQENLGFAGGMNRVVSVALKDPNVRAVLLLNNDMELTTRFLPELVHGLNSSGADFVSGVAVRPGSTAIENKGIGLSSWGLTWNIVDKTRLSVPSGGCLLFTRSAVEKLSVEGELFDSSFFLYMEDVDLGLRAVRRGVRHEIIPQAQVFHESGASSKKTPDTTLFYWHRNHLLMMWKNFPVSALVLNAIPIVFLQIAIILLYCLRGKGKIVMRATWQGLCGFSRVVRERKAYDLGLRRHEFRSITQSNMKGIQAWCRLQYP